MSGATPSFPPSTLTTRQADCSRSIIMIVFDDQDGIVCSTCGRKKVVKKVPIPGVGMPSGFVYDGKRTGFMWLMKT